jgi:outer membrane protein assembly factor BamE
MKNLMLSSLCVALLGGCGLTSLKLPELKLPRVYKISVQQGNVINQEMVDRLKPGMTRNQVSFILGDTVVKDPFEPNRWVYLYTLDVPDYFYQTLRVTLDFEDDLLTTISGDLVPQNQQEDEEAQTDVDAEEDTTSEAT